MPKKEIKKNEAKNEHLGVESWHLYILTSLLSIFPRNLNDSTFEILAKKMKQMNNVLPPNLFI